MWPRRTVTLWTASKARNEVRAVTRKLAGGGLELRIEAGRRRVMSEVYNDAEAMYTVADRHRVELELQGWTTRTPDA